MHDDNGATAAPCSYLVGIIGEQTETQHRGANDARVCFFIPIALASSLTPLTVKGSQRGIESAKLAQQGIETDMIQIARNSTRKSYP